MRVAYYCELIVQKDSSGTIEQSVDSVLYNDKRGDCPLRMTGKDIIPLIGEEVIG